MKNILLTLVLLLPLGLSNCTEIQKKFSDLTVSSNSVAKNVSAQKVGGGINENSTATEHDNESKVSITGYFVLGDGTYSNTMDYVVPRLSTSFLERLINKCRLEGGGFVWVSYIDTKSRDNETLFIKVSAPVHGTTAKPNFMAEGAVNYKKRKLAWESQYRKVLADSLAEAQQFSKMKQKFLDDSYSLLKNKVYIKSERNKLSDVMGSLESAMKVLTDAKRSNVISNCAIIGFSDFENDPDCPAMQADPAVKVYNLISQPGKAKSAIPGSVEVIDVDYLLSIL
jgi:hypothetical protein